MWVKLIIGIMLGISSLEDMKKKTLRSWYPILVCVIGVAIQLWQKTFFASGGVIGALLGFVILGFAQISKGQFGIGDGLLLTACGICLGWRRQLMLMGVALLLFLVVGAVEILFKHRSGRTPVAFVPYLCVAYVIQCLWADI